MRSKRRVRILWRWMSWVRKMKTRKQMNGHVYIIVAHYHHEVTLVRRLRCRAARGIPLGLHKCVLHTLLHLVADYFTYNTVFIRFALRILGHGCEKQIR